MGMQDMDELIHGCSQRTALCVYCYLVLLFHLEATEHVLLWGVGERLGLHSPLDEDVAVWTPALRLPCNSPIADTIPSCFGLLVCLCTCAHVCVCSSAELYVKCISTYSLILVMRSQGHDSPSREELESQGNSGGGSSSESGGTSPTGGFSCLCPARSLWSEFANSHM